MHGNLRALLGAVLLVVVAALAWYLWQKPLVVRNYPSAGTDIIAIGDSLVAGTGATKGQDFVSLLAARIGRPIVNLGVPGDTTESLLARLSVLDKYNPKVVVVLVGGNDYLRRTPRTQTFANLRSIVANIQERGAVVLLLGIRGGVLVDNFDQEFDALRRSMGTAYVPDVLAGLLGDSQYMADQIHPNNAGYAHIAGRVYPVLAPLLN